MVTFSDPLFAKQWHFKLLGDVNRIWDDYSGAGVTVGVYDDGLQYNHPDLNDNYDASLHFEYDGETYDPYPRIIQPGWNADGHGTSVAGIIAGEAGNGLGGVGVAWGATLTGVSLLGDPRFFDGTDEAVLRENAAFRHAASFDIMSNSWGYGFSYDNNGNIINSPYFTSFFDRGDAGSVASVTLNAMGFAVETGRGGLGTIIVKSAGNDAYNANGEGINGSHLVINVSALTQNGQIASYSNYGTSILVSAGAASVTTDLTGSNGYNTSGGSAGNYANDFGGTSASAPVVTGVVALMLDANDDLGWRDVREILATSAALTGSVVTGNQDFEVSGTYFQANAGSGDTWNDGGRAYSLDYGFGNVNAFAAVRMAEIWSLFGDAKTSANEEHLTAALDSPVVFAIRDSDESGTVALDVDQAFRIENIDLTVTAFLSPSITTRNVSITVIAPDGTYFPVLLEIDGISPPTDGTPISWTFGITHALGLNAEGTWSVRFEMESAYGITLPLNITEVSLDFHGSAWDVDNVHHITGDWQRAHSSNSGGGRNRVINDTNGGDDWINMAAIAGAVTATLDSLGRILVAGQQWATIAAGAIIENIVTGDGADSLTGSAQANRIHGMRGNDTISGLGGEDSLDGGAGNDRLSGGDSNDSLSGGSGNDRLSGDIGDDRVSGGSGKDSLYGGDGDDTLLADAGDDVLLGGNGNDLMNGGADKDMLSGESGNDTIDGGVGNDTITGGAGADSLAGGEGNDLFVISAFVDHGTGEVIVGGGGTDELRYTGTTAGTLTLNDSVFVERVVVGTGTGAAAVLTATTAIDIDARHVLGAITLVGNAGANRLTGGAFGDSLVGGAGNDTLQGGIGNDTLVGGTGVDVASFALESEDLALTLTGGPLVVGRFGTDILSGIEGLEGGYGNDSLTGDAGANRLIGGEGNDLLAGGAGNDTLTGDVGFDTASYATAVSAVTVNLGLKTAQVTGGAGTDVLGGIEGLIGSNFSDVLTGSAGANRIDGGVGKDRITGGAGADTLSGGSGNDLFVIQAFADHAAEEAIVGDGGTDELRFTGTTAGTLTLDAGVNVERVVIGTGTGATAVLTGTAAINVDASALLQGVALTGNAGANRLTGSGFGDRLDGGSGSDSLTGGAGDDTLTGGAGADVFVFDSAIGGGDVDRITDFNVVSDTIRLDDLAFAGLAAGVVAASAFASNLAGMAMDELDRIIYESATGNLYFDADGSGAGDRIQFASLSASLSLTNADFFVF